MTAPYIFPPDEIKIIQDAVERVARDAIVTLLRMGEPALTITGADPKGGGFQVSIKIDNYEELRRYVRMVKS